MEVTATKPGPVSLADYAMVGDRQTCALISRDGSIDWCCMPRFDSGGVFCRLLDGGEGGHCAMRVAGGEPVGRRYLDDCLVLETEWRAEAGEARVLDFFRGPPRTESPEVVRLVEAIRGSVEVEVEVAPRFDYGEVAPWLRCRDSRVATAIGGDDGLLVQTDFDFERAEQHRLAARFRLDEGERRRLVLRFERPIHLEPLEEQPQLDAGAVDEALESTQSWWREWARGGAPGDGRLLEGARRSALILKALCYEKTGAVVAAATTSIPEALDGDGARNWDYRYSWIRDSALSVRSLAELGWVEDADCFRRFIERSSAGHAGDLQILYGIGGERRLVEGEAECLRGYRGSRPVRLGNGASGQFQLDAFGHLVDQTWHWHRRGNSPDREYWSFTADLVDTAVRRWRDPDKGFWEWRGEEKHFVHSKALAWAAVDRGVRLAEDCGYEVPPKWREAREEIREAVEDEGYDERRGIFVQAFGEESLDAALLRMPTAGFLDWEDERMVRTATAIREALDFDGLIRRYDADDGMPPEGAFLAASFWLATCFARQRRLAEARAMFDRTMETANDLGIFSEEFDPRDGRMLGNVPQALTHLSHIEAALALRECAGEGGGEGD